MKCGVQTLRAAFFLFSFLYIIKKGRIFVLTN